MKPDNQHYNTDINILGSIPDFQLIFESFPLMVEGSADLFDTIVSKNEYNLRTAKSRKRFTSVLKSALLNEDDRINKIVADGIVHFANNSKAKALLVFWLLSLNNKLFFEINRDVFLKNYFNGRVALPKDDVLAYLKEIVANDKNLKEKWSDSTVEIIASKYLTLMKKLSLMEGGQKKSFVHVSVSDEMLTLFLHIFTYLTDNNVNFYDHPFSDFSFISDESKLERLKKLGLKNMINIKSAGGSLVVKEVFEPQNIIDGIFGRT